MLKIFESIIDGYFLIPIISDCSALYLISISDRDLDMGALEDFAGYEEYDIVNLLKEKLQKLLDILEDNDDVQNVWHNWEEPQE